MKFVLNGTEVTPDNVLTLALSSDFTGRPEELEVDTDKLIFKREGYDVIKAWRDLYGPIHGIPLQIITNSNQTLDYYVDLMDDSTTYYDFHCEVSIKRRKGKWPFWDNARGTSFKLMLEKGVSFNFEEIPYILVQDDAVTKALTLAVALYTLTKELIDQIVALSETITNIIDAVTPQTGTGVTFSIGQIATLIIKAILQLAIIALLLVAIVEMSQQFFELIFPKIRYFKACKVKELISKGCAYLGYQLQSNLLNEYSNLTILPKPFKKDKESFWDVFENDLNFAFNYGVPTSQDSVSTLADAIEFVEKYFNAKTKVLDGVVRIERRRWYISTANVSLTPALNDQSSRRRFVRLNTEDVWKRTYIHYQTDPVDSHTMDFFDPTDAEYSTEPTSIPNEDLVLIKGYNDINIPFALGVRKNGLNWLEELAKGFFEVVDEVVNAFGGNGNYTGQITNRDGVLQISQQFFSVTKLMWTVGGKQPENYVEVIGASAIYHANHTDNEINENDYFVNENVPFRINDEDFINLNNHNYADIDGKHCEILTIKFLEQSSFAEMTYLEPYDWANGKTTVIEIND